MMAASVEKWASVCPPIKAVGVSGIQVGERAAEVLYRFQERANRTGKKVSSARRKLRTLRLAALRRIAHSSVDWGVGREDIDVFHSTFRSPPDWLSPAVPRVITIHDVIPLRFKAEYDAITLGTLESVIASLDPKRDFVTAVSQYTKEDFCDLSGFPAERVIVAPLSAGDRFVPAREPACGGPGSLQTGGQALLAVGFEPSATQEYSAVNSELLQCPAPASVLGWKSGFGREREGRFWRKGDSGGD
jgi:hypothetical protein